MLINDNEVNQRYVLRPFRSKLLRTTRRLSTLGKSWLCRQFQILLAITESHGQKTILVIQVLAHFDYSDVLKERCLKQSHSPEICLFFFWAKEVMSNTRI